MLCGIPTVKYQVGWYRDAEAEFSRDDWQEFIAAKEEIICLSGSLEFAWEVRWRTSFTPSAGGRNGTGSGRGTQGYFESSQSRGYQNEVDRDHRHPGH